MLGSQLHDMHYCYGNNLKPIVLYVMLLSYLLIDIEKMNSQVQSLDSLTFTF